MSQVEESVSGEIMGQWAVRGTKEPWVFPVDCDVEFFLSKNVDNQFYDIRTDSVTTEYSPSGSRSKLYKGTNYWRSGEKKKNVAVYQETGIT